MKSWWARVSARSAAQPSITPWRATTPSLASAPASATSTSTFRKTSLETPVSQGCCGPSPRAACANLLSDEGDDFLSNEALITVFDLHLLEPELRPAAAMVCTETVWAAAAQDPKPRLLVVDEVWSIMQHPEGAAFMVSMAKRARKHRLGLQFITQDVQDLLSEDSSRTITGHSGRALLQNAAFKLLLQQDAAAISTVGDAFDLPKDLQRWLLSCPRGDGLLLAKGNRFPVRIEATPEETAVIEWRPGQHGQRPLPPPVESATTDA